MKERIDIFVKHLEYFNPTASVRLGNLVDCGVCGDGNDILEVIPKELHTNFWIHANCALLKYWKIIKFFEFMEEKDIDKHLEMYNNTISTVTFNS